MLNKYGVTAGITKAFIMIGIYKEECDYTRFKWVKDSAYDPDSEIITFRFKTVWSKMKRTLPIVQIGTFMSTTSSPPPIQLKK